MAIAGADIIVCHMGLTTGGTIGAHTALKLADCPARIEAWAAAALSVHSNIIVLAHGGHIATPADADFILKKTRNAHGFYGASSMERLPVERALTDQVRKFKAIGARERRRRKGGEDVGDSGWSIDPLVDRRDHRDRHRGLYRQLALSPLI